MWLRLWLLLQLLLWAQLLLLLLLLLRRRRRRRQCLCVLRLQLLRQGLGPPLLRVLE